MAVRANEQSPFPPTLRQNVCEQTSKAPITPAQRENVCEQSEQTSKGGYRFAKTVASKASKGPPGTLLALFARAVVAGMSTHQVVHGVQQIQDGNYYQGEFSVTLGVFGLYAATKIKLGACFVAGTQVFDGEVLGGAVGATQVSAVDDGFFSSALAAGAAGVVAVGLAGYLVHAPAIQRQRRGKRAPRPVELALAAAAGNRGLKDGDYTSNENAFAEIGIRGFNAAELQSLASDCDHGDRTHAASAVELSTSVESQPEDGPVITLPPLETRASLECPRALRRTTNSTGRFAAVWLACCLLVAAGLGALAWAWRGGDTAESATDMARTTPSTTAIEHVRLGQRVAGRTPLREQVDAVEPDPVTWRTIRLRMTKDSGLGLWIDLLRPLAWIEEHNAKPGATIFLDLDEMGAVGEAEVAAIEPCPDVPPGQGAVVTGAFKHQVDEHTQVVHLTLEGQIEPTGVTANHPCWSEDRQDFVEVGALRPGERVDTVHGLRRVVAITPIDHAGFLYNLETTEHVYRAGESGALVHNSCAPTRKFDGRIHHIASDKNKTFTPLFESLFDRAGLSMQSGWNRMRISGHVGPHGQFYNRLVYERLSAAVGTRTGISAKQALIGELKAIRRDIRHGGWDARLKAPAPRADVRGNF